MRTSTKLAALAAAAITLLMHSTAMAKQWLIASNSEFELILPQVEAGDHLLLEPGVYYGSWVVDKPLTIRGHHGTIIDASGAPNGLVISASDVNVSRITVRNFGADLEAKHAGILVTEGHQNISLTGNEIVGPGFGIRIDGSNHVQVIANKITGDPSLPVIERGDGIYVRNGNEIEVSDNHVSAVRDGIYVETGDGALLRRNQFRTTQYPIHFMYYDDADVYENHSHDSDGGYALMSSKNVRLYDNAVRGAREFGVLLNMSQQCEVSHNRIAPVINPRAKEMFDGEGKGIFIYGAMDNNVYNNTIIGSEVGISMALGGEGNKIHNNAFINNQRQVAYVGNKPVDWSHQQQGNYWSNYQSWDLDRNGVADQAFQPNDGIDRLFMLYPEARFLMDSPMVLLLRWLDSQMSKPAPEGVFDPYPFLTAEAALTSNQQAENIDE